VINSEMVLSCPLCSHNFPHESIPKGRNVSVFGYGLDYRLVPRDCNRASDVAACPECFFSYRVQDFGLRIPGQVKSLVKSNQYIKLFEKSTGETPQGRSWIAFVSVLAARNLNPRDLGIMSLKGSWAARELGCLETEAELLDMADEYLDNALRRGLTKGDPGLVMYLLGEINRRRGCFERGREMLAFLGNNPRYRYPALLLTVLLEERDTTPYWSHHAPDRMEQSSPGFKGLFPALRSIPPNKTIFSPDELEEQSTMHEEDDGKSF
jgi:hypothetical protein